MSDDFTLTAPSSWQVRSLNGWHQSREGAGKWQFHVSGFDGTFTGQAGYCYVLRADGHTERVPIDAQDRIQIDGKRYGRAHWNH